MPPSLVRYTPGVHLPDGLSPESLIMTAPVPWGVVTDGTLTMANDALTSLFGQRTTGLVGRRLPDLLMQQDRVVTRSMLRGREQWQQRVRVLMSDGAIANLVLTGAPLPATSSHLVVAFDETERVRTAEQLRQLRNDALGLAERQQSFVASVTHELRSPLHAILGLAELLQGNAQSGDSAELTRLIDAARRLEQTVDELLELARAQDEDVRLELSDVDIRATVGAVVERTRAATRDTSATLHMTIDPDVPDRLRTDAYRVDQIVTNLLSNAVAHAHAGEVHTSIGVVEGDSLVIAVADSGPGVPEDYREDIFRPFVRVPGAPLGGTGLGLPLVRALARALHGDVELHCPPDGGAIFTVRLPMLSTQDAATASGVAGTDGGDVVRGDDSAVSGAEVLVVEDTPMIQLLAERQLEQLGHRPTVVATGREAVAAVRAAPDAYDVVLMDWQLPDIDGATCTTQLRREAAELRVRHLPVIAITANAMPDTRAACMAAGMDDFLAKPVSLQALGRALDAVLVARPDSLPSMVVQSRLQSLINEAPSATVVHDTISAHLDRLGHELVAFDDGIAGAHERHRRLYPHRAVMTIIGCRRLADAVAALEAGEMSVEMVAEALDATRDAVAHVNAGARA